MSPVEDHAQLASDAELITRVRAGDRPAFGDLYSRHASAASALARQFARSATDADDLVSEAFARVLDGLLEGKGPDTAFRAYLFTTVRNTAYDRSRKDKRLQFTADMERHDVAIEGDDPVIADLESGLIGKAFAGLPERWQTVLWHTQVDGQSAAEVGVLLGMAPNAVSSLAFRAREGLREAYLQAHLAETAAERCRTTVDRLGAWTRGGLSKRERAQVDAHLEECGRCPMLAAELSEINTGLRGLLAPLLLGGAAVGYISTLGPVTPLAQLGVLAGGHAGAAGGTAATHGSGSHLAIGLAKVGSWGPRAAVAGVAAAAVVVVGITIALTAGRSSAPDTAGRVSGPAGTVASSGTGINGGGTGANGGGGNAGPAGANGGPGGGTSGNNGAGTNSAGAGGPGTNSPGTNSTATQDSSASTVAGVANNGSNAAGTAGTTAPGTPVTTPNASPSTPTIPTLIAALPPTTPGSIGTAPSTAVGLGTSPGNSPPGNSSPGSSVTATSAPGTSAPAANTGPSSGSTDSGSSPPSTSSTPTAQTDPTSDTSTSAPTATSETSTSTPPIGAIIGLDPSGSVVSADLAAGGNGSLTVKLVNSGDTSSKADQTVTVTPPNGFALGDPTLVPARGLRGAFSAFAATSARCSAGGVGSSVCSLPAIAPNTSLTMIFDLQVTPTARSGVVSVSFDSGPPNHIQATVLSGYTGVSLTSSADLGRAAISFVTLTATPRTGVATPGDISIPVAIADHMTIVALAPTGGLSATESGCSIHGANFVCPSDRAISGVRVPVQVTPEADGGEQATNAASDEGDRTFATGSLTVSTNANGGYVETDPPSNTYPITLTPVGPLALGTTGSVRIVGHVADGVLDPGAITLPISLAPGITVDVQGLPTGCTATDSTVICSPHENGGSAEFTLPVIVAPDAAGGPLASVTLPTDAKVVPVASDGSAVTIEPVASGYGSITGELHGLNAGSTTTLTLIGTPGPGVSDAGDVTVSTDLADGVRIVGGDCAITSGTANCRSGSDGEPTIWKLTVQIAGAAPQFTLDVLPSVTLAGGGHVTPDAAVGTDLTIRQAATAACATPAALDNGDFESPTVADGANNTAVFDNNPARFPTLVWQTTATDHQIEFWRTGGNSTSANDGKAISAENGSQWVELNANQASALYQDVQTVPGQVMRWTIWHRARAVGGSPKTDHDTMQVQIGVPGNMDDVTVVSDGPKAWVQHTGSYTVPAGQIKTRFQFAAISTASGNASVGNFLDNISFSTVPCLTTTTAVSNLTAGTSGAKAAPGDTLRYTTTIKNAGGDTATGVELDDLIPAGTTYVAGSRTTVPPGIDPGDTVTVTFEVTVNNNLPDDTLIYKNDVVSYLWETAGRPLTAVSTTMGTRVTGSN